MCIVILVNALLSKLCLISRFRLFSQEAELTRSCIQATASFDLNRLKSSSFPTAEVSESPSTVMTSRHTMTSTPAVPFHTSAALNRRASLSGEFAPEMTTCRHVCDVTCAVIVCRCGVLQEGDRVLAINDAPLEGRSLQECNKLLNESGMRITLLVQFDVAGALRCM